MVHRTEVDCKSNPLKKVIEPIHISITKDSSFVGCDVYSVTDLELLTTWWQRGEKLHLNQAEYNDFKTRQLKDLHGAVWVQLNILLSKTLLTFQDVLNEVKDTAGA